MSPFVNLQNLNHLQTLITAIQQHPDNLPLTWAAAECGNGLAHNTTGTYTLRREANALTALAFRNGPLEDIHAKTNFTNDEMRGLMIDASRKLFALLSLRDELQTTPQGREIWQAMMNGLTQLWCKGWDEEELPPGVDL